MLKKCFIAAGILMASSTLATAQDIFWSFSPTEVVTTTDGALGCNPNIPTPGSAYIFTDGNYDFEGVELEFTSSDPGVIKFTGGEAFNPTFNVVGGTRFDAAEITVDTDGSSGVLFLANVTQNGVAPATASFDPGFVAEAAPNGARLLARVDFEVVDAGAFGFADFELALGPQGVVQIFGLNNPSFGSAVLFVSVPGCLPPGDLDGSGAVDFQDIPLFVAALLSGEYLFPADCNSDGVVNFLDIASFIAILSGD